MTFHSILSVPNQMREPQGALVLGLEAFLQEPAPCIYTPTKRSN